MTMLTVARTTRPVRTRVAEGEELPCSPDVNVELEGIAVFGHFAIVARNHRADVPRDNLDTKIADRDALEIRASGRKRLGQMADEIGHHDNVRVIVELPVAQVADCKEGARCIDLQSEENLLDTGQVEWRLATEPTAQLAFGDRGPAGQLRATDIGITHGPPDQRNKFTNREKRFSCRIATLVLHAPALLICPALAHGDARATVSCARILLSSYLFVQVHDKWFDNGDILSDLAGIRPFQPNFAVRWVARVQR